MGINKTLTIVEMKNLASARGGECLSENYINNYTKLTWRCSCGTEWDAKPGQVKRGTWCPRCGIKSAGRKKALSIEKMQDLARGRHGQCLSEEYFTNRHPLVWQCKFGHQWSATPAHIVAGRWCPECAGVKELSLAEMDQIASTRKGQCLSKTYVNSNRELKWQCDRGHIWMAAPHHVKAGRWCPKCATARRSEILRERTKERLAELAKEKGGNVDLDGYKNCRTKVHWVCSLGHAWRASPHLILAGTWCPRCAKTGSAIYTMADARAIARYNRGRCLSLELHDENSELQWTCRRGHVWYMSLKLVLSQRWCRECTLGRQAATEIQATRD